MPIVVPDTAATSDLLGMKLSDLEAEIRDFWITLHSRQGSDTSRASQRKLQGGSGMTSKDSGTHFHAPVHFDGPTTFGAQSPAVSGGNVNVAYLQKQGVDLEKLNEVFNTLLSEIANIRSDDDRDRLNDDAERLKDKLGKEKVGDPNALKGLFDRMERAAKPLENGTKIITALTSIYKLVAVPLGLPPLP
ncbi:MAG: hypothetical protein HWD60_00795 [Defluviicoccus sp.]|nr:MAG: hypothetical protein HWD60_00795 [Defluviicoccus sp.]